MIAVEAISSASNGAEMGCFAAINKSWQILIEAETFRNIHVALLAKDQSGVNYLLPMLTPARLAHLEELTIDIEWPFFVSAQKKRRFSAADAVSQMFGTVLYLAFFLRRLGRVDRAPTARGLNIVLQTIRPARVAPTGSASQRIMERRRRLPAEISSWWSDADLLKLAPLQRRKWVRSTDAALFNECPAVHAVTGLAFPPDFFPPSTMQLLLGRFPNLRAMRLDPLCELRNPEGWRAGQSHLPYRDDATHHADRCFILIYRFLRFAVADCHPREYEHLGPCPKHYHARSRQNLCPGA